MIKNSKIVLVLKDLIAKTNIPDEVMLGDYDLTSLVAGKTIAVITPMSGEYSNNRKINSMLVILLTRTTDSNLENELISLYDNLNDLAKNLHGVTHKEQDGVFRIEVINESYEHYPAEDGSGTFIYLSGVLELRVISQ